MKKRPEVPSFQQASFNTLRILKSMSVMAVPEDSSETASRFGTKAEITGGCCQSSKFICKYKYEILLWYTFLGFVILLETKILQWTFHQTRTSVEMLSQHPRCQGSFKNTWAIATDSSCTSVKMWCSLVAYTERAVQFPMRSKIYLDNLALWHEFWVDKHRPGCEPMADSYASTKGNNAILFCECYF